MKRMVSALLTLFIVGSLCAQNSGDTTNLMNLGDTMPKFKLTTFDGKAFDSKDLKGKVVLINFFATWCPPCMKELPELEKDIWKKYADNSNFVLLVISREEPVDKVKAWIPTKGLDLPYFPDPTREVYAKFAKANIPRNYLFNTKGKLVYQSMGFRDTEFEKLKESLADLLQ